jgi:peptidase E
MVRFVSPAEVRAGLAGMDSLVVSGGDAFGMADALGAEGAEGIRKFTERGGAYLGSCAGAYIAAKTSKPPLDMFSLTGMRVRNLSKDLPTGKRLSEECCNPHGCGFIFHPVRGLRDRMERASSPLCSVGR